MLPIQSGVAHVVTPNVPADTSNVIGGSDVIACPDSQRRVVAAGGVPLERIKTNRGVRVARYAAIHRRNAGGRIEGAGSIHA
jgi:hypothetical protein